MKLIERPENLFGRLFNNQRIPLFKLAVASLFTSGIYGFVLGNYSRGIMYLYDAVKIPIVIFCTMAICLPSMFLFSYVFKIEMTFKQLANIVWINIYMLCLGLFSVIAMVWFWQNFYPDYRFNVLILVSTFSFSWILAVYTTWNNLKGVLKRISLAKLLSVWIVVFTVVATQMIWIFRPWVGYKYLDNNLPFIRSLEGDIYTSVYLTFKTWFERNLF